ncbi:MAG: PEP-utilizing enzyme, partial [Pseudomonadota bacterium]
MSVDIGWIGLPGPRPTEAEHGPKAALLASAADAGLPVPPGFVLPDGYDGQIGPLLAALGSGTGRHLDDAAAPLLLAARPSTSARLGAGLPAVLNIGVTAVTMPALIEQLGERTAYDLHRRAIHSFGIGALGIEGEEFEYALHDAMRLAGCDSEGDLAIPQLRALAETCFALIDEEGMGPYPERAENQLGIALGAMRRNWSAPRSVTRRQALGDDPNAPLAIIVQSMAVGLGSEPCGAGFADFRDEATGKPRLVGRYLPQAQGDEVMMGMRTPHVLTHKERTSMGLHDLSLEEMMPGITDRLVEAGMRIESAIGDAVSLDFVLEDGALWIVEIRPARRSARAAVEIAVSLAERGVRTREQALLAIDPAHLEEQLHPAIDPNAQRSPIGQGLPASPGAASGPLAFTPDDAEAAASRGEAAILALVETSPEDIRGMHAARAVLTMRGGMTSHAAVVARGLGKPCVVGAKDLQLDAAECVLSTSAGERLRAGDTVTVDGTTGQILAGAVGVIMPEATKAFTTLLDWADDVRRLGVRANADTSVDAETARGFGAGGIGLCRTEHMFFQRGRIMPMREMILAETTEERRRALAEL